MRQWIGSGVVRDPGTPRAIRWDVRGLLAAVLLLAGCAQTGPSRVADLTPLAPAAAAALPAVPNAQPPPTAIFTPTAVPTAVVVPSPQSGIQPIVDPGLIEVPLQVPSDLAHGVFASPLQLRLPAGYHIGLFAAGLNAPRGLAISPAGDLFVTVMGSGQVAALLDPGHAGHATDVRIFADNIAHPHGIAFANGWVYIGDTGAVLRFKDSTGGFHADQREVVVPNLPSNGGHSTRTVHVGPDGKLYVSIGSSCNSCIESDPRRAAIVQYNLDGTGEHIFGQGLRNAVGFTFQPVTGYLWAVVNGRDNLGDDLPGEDVTVVQDGNNFGWPLCYGDHIPDPQLGSAAACAAMTDPTLQIQAHSAPLGASFYTGQQFPAQDRQSLFVSIHGSWNRTTPTGYKVVEVTWKNGQPSAVQDFAKGWQTSGSPWGRPVDLVMGPDGSIFVSDDTAGAVYRIWYDGN